MNRQEAIESLKKLPDEIIDRAYEIEVIAKKVKMQYNEWLEDKYRHLKDLSGDKNWFVFRIGEWDVKMETEEDHINPVMGKILNDFEKGV